MAYWAATQFQPHRERVAEHFLGQFGFEVYLPRVRRHVRRGQITGAKSAARRRSRFFGRSVAH